MWEADPEMRAKLLILQKQPANSHCVDCNAPSPQWASPKNGIFICLTCAGTHRGLGVHISFVRSITMDGLKAAELKRMELGGNERWKEFYDNHELNKTEGRSFDDASLRERYDCVVAEEWRDRLTAAVEGKEYVPRPFEERRAIERPRTQIAINTQKLNSISSTRVSRTSSPTVLLSPSQKTRNEAFFERLGRENAMRSESLPPSQGGKYGGFGSDPFPQQQNKDSNGVPGLDEWQKDPVGALTRGFGWFTTTVGKSARQVNETYVTPGIQKIQTNAAPALQNARQTTLQSLHTAQESLTRFVEGVNSSNPSVNGTSSRRVDPERKDFWDSFGVSDDRGVQKSSKVRGGSAAIGTSTMKGNVNGTNGRSSGEGWDDAW